MVIISRVAVVITYIRGLILPFITTHEPPSKLTTKRLGMLCCSCLGYPRDGFCYRESLTSKAARCSDLFPSSREAGDKLPRVVLSRTKILERAWVGKTCLRFDRIGVRPYEPQTPNLNSKLSNPKPYNTKP